MKKVIIICTLFLMANSVFSQDRNNGEYRTIFGGNGIKSHGGYGAVTTGYSRIADRDAILIGGHGAWLIDHRIGIGISGTGFMTERKYDTELDSRYMLAGGYGGLRLEYIILPNSPVHLSIPITIGAGGVGYSRSESDFEIDGSLDSSAFFVFEPAVELEFNLIRLMRMSIGASYRHTSDVSLRYVNSSQRIVGQDAMRGFSATISFKFGKF